MIWKIHLGQTWIAKFCIKFPNYETFVNIMVDYPSILHLLHIPKLTYTYKSLVATALLVTNFAVPLCIYYLLLMICCQFLNFVIPSNNEIEYCTVQYAKKKSIQITCIIQLQPNHRPVSFIKKFWFTKLDFNTTLIRKK